MAALDMPTSAGDWADVATTAGVLIALILGVVGSVLTWRGQKQDARLATASAERSEAAAALTEEYTRRVVEALETLATQGEGDGVERSEVRWSLRHWSGDTYQLENAGTGAASDVKVTAHESMIFRPPEEADLAPGEAITFVAARSLGTSDSTITVQWVDSESDENIWRYPLPPRPKR